MLLRLLLPTATSTGSCHLATAPPTRVEGLRKEGRKEERGEKEGDDGERTREGARTLFIYELPGAEVAAEGNRRPLPLIDTCCFCLLILLTCLCTRLMAMVVVVVVSSNSAPLSVRLCTRQSSAPHLPSPSPPSPLNLVHAINYEFSFGSG